MATPIISESVSKPFLSASNPKCGSVLSYKVSSTQLQTHAGVPVFGLYPDMLNTVEVSYMRHFNGKAEQFTDTYRFYAPPVYTVSNGTAMQTSSMFKAKVVKMDPAFKDRLYLVDGQFIPIAPQGGRMVWSEPMGGALTWGFGQRCVKYELMGREVFNRRLPLGFNDFSHAFDNAQSGKSLLRVASSDYRRPDGKHVRTVRDVIIEVDKDGRVTDQWRLPEILDPYRDNVLKALDMGAVCLNIDVNKMGRQ